MNRVFAWPVGKDRGFSLGAGYSALFLVSGAAGGLILGALSATAVIAARALPYSLLRPVGGAVVGPLA